MTASLEKKTAYLDHNFLDKLSKGYWLEFFGYIRDNYRVVYSDATLKEIKRSGLGAPRFIDALCFLEAEHIRIILTDEFDSTNFAYYTSLSPKDVFSEYCENLSSIYEGIEESTIKSLLKMYGGLNGVGFEEINKYQKNSFSELVNDLSEKNNEIREINPDVYEKIKNRTSGFQESFDAALAQSSEHMKKYVSDDLGFSGVQTYRSEVEITPKILNNIKPPNVIEKIFDLYKRVDDYKNFSIEQFLGISWNEIYKREMHTHEKIRAIYNLLNFIGYVSDSNMKKERRLVAAMSDADHAAMASFIDVLFSLDEKFVIKTEAVYEYLGCHTKVAKITFHKQQADN
ncbi:hypothetical protein ACLPHM_16910 [Paenalcaligenes sp. Me131]|uniref:hypothetical protein n=1 Tax=Paenalcaligenes sp. Me131 TaxID=3392636 RepID=UPI003D27827A